MTLQFLLALVACAVNVCHAQNRTTWVISSHITDKYVSSSTIKYGSAAVTPVSRSTTLDITTSYISEPPTSSDSTRTTWITEQATFPIFTQTLASTTTLSQPITVTSNGTYTVTVMVSPTIATITLSPTACAGSNASATTVTEYTGTYSTFPGQVLTTPTAWPTAVTTYMHLTVTYRLLTHVGSIVTTTSTVTGSNWLSTTTTKVDKTVTINYYRFTSTSYLNTVTSTESDWQLAYTTKAATTACVETTTVTRAAQCAPTNLIAERDGHGAAVQLLPLDWRFPIDFPNTLIGIPGMDASACCQLCLDNPGCAASEWTIEWSGACRLFYYGHGNNTCGGGNVTLEYYGDVYAFPRQESYIQAGCGALKYYGVKDPFCPTCAVDK